MRKIILIIFLNFTFIITAQEPSVNSKTIYGGIGYASFDRTILGQSLELGYEVKLNTSFTFNGNYTYAWGENSEDPDTYTKQNQFNALLLYSPFKNNNKLDFRLGIGGSLAYIKNQYIDIRYKKNEQVYGGFFLHSSIWYQVSPQYKLGAKIEHQGYYDGIETNDIISFLIGYNF